VRFLPVIAAAEVKSVLPAANPHQTGNGHAQDHAFDATVVGLAPKGAH
jgi:hypothetical protein